MTVLGQIVVLLALLAVAASTVLYSRVAMTGAGSLLHPRRMFLAGAFCIGLASLLLLVLFLRHDFSNGYVYSYSDRSLPLQYLISCFYAGQEGSFLFWALCAAGIGIALRAWTRKRGSEAAIMAVYGGVLTLLLVLIEAKSPFRSVWEMFPQGPTTVPVDGRGLNPLLQNLWMVIHPPVLFLGFAALAVPFSMAIAGLWQKNYTILPAQTFPWILFAASVLGLGLMLGAYWAYGVLGWGGYWGWDPVENSSLVPWLTAVAFLHTLLAQLRTGKYVRTNFALALVTFLLVLYSTFLTRSGILGDASVHSFTDPGAVVFALLLGVLALLTLGSAALLALRWNDLRPEKGESGLVTRETMLGAGTLMILILAAIVLFGTSLPIFSATRVEPSFYDATGLPAAIILVVLIAVSLQTQWEIQDVKGTWRRLLPHCAAAAVIVVILFLLGMRDASVVVLVWTSLVALFVNVDAAIKIVRGNFRFIGGKIAHAGIALVLMGIVLVGRMETTEHVGLPLNAPRTVLGRTMIYTGHTQEPDGKFRFTVEVREGERAFVLSPIMENTGERGLMRTPDIASTISRDVYISPVSLEEGREEGRGETASVNKGATAVLGGITTKFARFDMRGHAAQGMTSGAGMEIGAVLELTGKSETETIVPSIVTTNGRQEYKPVPSKLMHADVALVGMHVGMGDGLSSVTLQVQRNDPVQTRAETLFVDASVKPWIVLLWAGTLIFTMGFIVAIVKRAKEA